MAVQHGDLSLTRLGHASVRIETDAGLVVYIDPWSAVIEERPQDGDVVFVTHDDPDHYDPDAIDAVATDSAEIVVYDRVDTAALDRAVTPLAAGGSLTVAGIDVAAVPAHNRPDGDHVDEDGRPFHAECEVIGLRLDVAGTTVYFASDTDFLPAHDGVRADLFMPPIGGHYTMDWREAADFAESVGPALVLPVHYDAAETDAEAFVAELADRGISAVLF